MLLTETPQKFAARCALDRGEDVIPTCGLVTACQQLAEAPIVQGLTEGRERLFQDLFSVREEQETRRNL